MQQGIRHCDIFSFESRRGPLLRHAMGQADFWSNLDDDPLDDIEEAPAKPVTPARRSKDQTSKERKRSWSDIAYERLSEDLRCNLRVRFSADASPLTYGSDCSGLDAPKHALEHIAETVHAATLKINLEAAPPRIIYTHASEANSKAGDGPKLAMTLNGSPQILVSDALNMKTTRRGVIGYDCYTQDFQAIVCPQIYTVGFECQDRSVCNTHAPKDLVVERDVSGEGMSSKTLDSSTKFIKATEPCLFIMEHPFRKDTLLKVKKVIKTQLKKYRARMWVTCSRQFGLPMRRRRLFVCGVNMEKCKLKLSMKRWTPILRQIAKAQAQEPLRLQDCIVDETHEARTLRCAYAF